MAGQGIEDSSSYPGLINPESDDLMYVYGEVAKKAFYDGNEQALYNPIYHQQVKLRGNGMTDVFVDNNTGIRIDPDTQSINMIANNLKNHVAAITSWVTGSHTEYIGANRYVKVGQDDTLEVSGDVTIIVKGNMKASVSGNVEANIKENATINVAKDVKVKSRNIDIVATKTLHLDAQTILIGQGKVDDHNAARWVDVWRTDEKGRRYKDRAVIESGKVWIG